MSYIEVSAYKCTCERCFHSWTAITIPRTCSKCRSPYWNVERGNKTVIEKPIAEKPELNELKDLIKTIEAKPKSDYYTKNILPSYPPKIDDQPDNYSEPTLNYD